MRRKLKIIPLLVGLTFLLNISPTLEFENGLSVESTNLLEVKAADPGYGFYQSFKIVTTVFIDIDHDGVLCVYEYEEEIFGFECDSSNYNACNPAEPTTTLIPVDYFCTSLPEILPGG